jgi:hypothetical protein
MRGRIKLYKPVSRFLYPEFLRGPYHLSRLPTPCTFWLNQKTNEQLASEQYRSYNVRGISTQEVYQAAAITCCTGGLLPHLFTLSAKQVRGGIPFCGTICQPCISAKLPSFNKKHGALCCPDFPPQLLKAIRRLVHFLCKERLQM